MINYRYACVDADVKTESLVNDKEIRSSNRYIVYTHLDTIMTLCNW